MARYRTHSVAFKRQVAQEYLSGETLHGLAKRHDLSRNLVRVWVQKYETGAFDDDAAAADELFSILMGEDVAARRSFIARNAKDVRFLDV